MSLIVPAEKSVDNKASYNGTDRNFEPSETLPQEQARLLVACDSGGGVLAFAYEPVDGER